MTTPVLIVPSIMTRDRRATSLPGYWVQLKQFGRGGKRWIDYVWYATQHEALVRAEDVRDCDGRWNFHVRIRQEM